MVIADTGLWVAWHIRKTGITNWRNNVLPNYRSKMSG
ncbi:hypothetical protein H206_12285 [Candidatus Electrothrix aarhusensis]|uniref:Uncharacterized protein n=1 Tax=Candidatus Electrothrix aarhusensis TaxID=1859131 RepID=A0A3S3R080_9BACT|nr:hypothetical protein H206_12285 [Candidatus Electrothrix aarhusensis]